MFTRIAVWEYEYLSNLKMFYFLILGLYLFLQSSRFFKPCSLLFQLRILNKDREMKNLLANLGVQSKSVWSYWSEKFLSNFHGQSLKTIKEHLFALRRACCNLYPERHLCIPRNVRQLKDMELSIIPNSHGSLLEDIFDGLHITDILKLCDQDANTMYIS